jgi:hypothetical protein
MSRSASLERNGILRPRRASEPHIGPIQREVPGYHGATRARGLSSARFFNPDAIWIPPTSKGFSGINLILGGVDVRDRSATRGSCQPIPCFLDAGVLLSGYPARTVFTGPSTPCGNTMIAAHVENLVHSTLPTGFPQSLGKVFDFPTIIGITASQLPPFPQGLRLLIFNLMRKSSTFEPSFVDSKLPI